MLQPNHVSLVLSRVILLPTELIYHSLFSIHYSKIEIFTICSVHVYSTCVHCKYNWLIVEPLVSQVSTKYLALLVLPSLQFEILYIIALRMCTNL